MSNDSLHVRKHTAFWLRHLRMLPPPYTTGDDQRMTFGFFCLGALDLLLGNNLGSKLSEQEQESYRSWIWKLQSPHGGFSGSPCSGDTGEAHLAMTYTALICLGILRDDFSQLNRPALRTFLSQQQDTISGSFSPSPSNKHERDPRFTYCAFAICYLTNDWSAIDVEKGLSFLGSCQSYDAGFAQGPGLESHGGSTYCSVAAFHLAGRSEGIGRRADLVRWLVQRQQSADPSEEDGSSSSSDDGSDSEEDTCITHGGFNGRLNKPVDTCYSFWCGASLSMLQSTALLNTHSNEQHLLSHQTNLGGFYKNNEQSHPDIMHSYLSLAALSLHNSSSSSSSGIEGVGELDAGLNCSVRTLEWIRSRLWT